MKIGFDYWQCISHYPKEFREMLGAFENFADDVYIISAIGKGRIGTIANEIQQIEGWKGFNPKWYNERIIEVVFDDPKQSPELKLAKCKELGIEMFFDDRDDVCRLLNANGIMALRVTRKDNSTYDLDAERK